MERNRAQRSSRSDLQLTIIAASFVPPILVVAFLIVNDGFISDSSPAVTAVISASIGTLYAYGFLLVRRRLNQLRVYRFRIALTGRPQAGKTVFSVLLFDSLMNGRLPEAEFTADSRSAISVYQAIRNLPAGRWPKSTGKGLVSVYAGAIESRRARVDLEVGDSAGEYWLDLSDRQDQDSAYLEYVLSAHAMAHVIPLDDLLEGGLDKQTTQDVDDLKLVARLRRQTRRHDTRAPLMIVVSKVDLAVSRKILEDPRAGLFRLVTAHELDSLRIIRHLTERQGGTRLREVLIALADQLEREFSSVHFVFSSAPVIAQNRLAVDDRGGDLVSWIQIEAARPDRSSRGLGGFASFLSSR